MTLGGETDKVFDLTEHAAAGVELVLEEERGGDKPVAGRAWHGVDGRGGRSQGPCPLERCARAGGGGGRSEVNVACLPVGSARAVQASDGCVGTSILRSARRGAPSASLRAAGGISRPERERRTSPASREASDAMPATRACDRASARSRQPLRARCHEAHTGRYVGSATAWCHALVTRSVCRRPARRRSVRSTTSVAPTTAVLRRPRRAVGRASMHHRMRWRPRRREPCPERARNTSPRSRRCVRRTRRRTRLRDPRREVRPRRLVLHVGAHPLHRGRAEALTTPPRAGDHLPSRVTAFGFDEPRPILWV